MSSWNSVPLEISYQIFGWIAFFSWGFSFYPQIILNFRRKSVVGLNFDFLVLNLTKHSTYLIHNAVLFFSPTVQRQYHERCGLDEMIPVAANDVAFSIHATLLTAFTLFQVFIYERGTQKVAKITFMITFIVWVAAAVCVFVAWPSKSWLWLISIFNSMQVFMTFIKYIPQMAMQSIDQGSWVNFYGNMGKALLSLVCMVYDVIFIVQRYVLYPHKNVQSPFNCDESTAPLVKSSHPSISENV